jgi:peptidyl-prolyl cis-trans isomerase A (cyclophilin A)
MRSISLLASAIVVLSACSSAPSAPPQAPAQAAPTSSYQPQANNKAPDTFTVNFDTTKGLVVVEVTRADAPNGADRFYNLVKSKFFDGTRFFRVMPGFVVQWGIAAEPAVTKTWDTPIPDDPVKQTNARGTLVFAAQSRPNTRTAQMFINLVDNGRLDQMGFAPFGKVTSGMEFVDQIFAGYRDAPDQDRITNEGNAYLEKEFPNLDYIKTAAIAK